MTMPATLGPYRLHGLLGRGGMGTVYRAQHPTLQREVAIKVLTNVERTGIPLERFRREARLHASLRHEHIVAVHDYLEIDGQPALVMEYVPGATVDQLLRSGPLPVPVATGIVRDVATALAYVHARGALHRDVKASNVKLRADGRAVLLDFGIARLEGDPRLTRTGMMVGSPHAAAPEQFENAPLTPRTDLWSLGVLFYEMVTGTPPFDGPTIAMLASQVVRGDIDPPSARRPGLPRAVDRLVMRAMARDPRQRYASADDLLAELARLDDPPPATLPARLANVFPDLGRRRLPPWALTASALLVALGGVLLMGARWRTRPTPAPIPALAPLVSTRIVLAEGQATVHQGVRVLGRTPYDVVGREGDTVRVVLRRPGYYDEPVRFVLEHDAAEFHTVMRRRPDGSNGDGLPGASLFGLGALFRRRRRPPAAVPPPHPATPVTGQQRALEPLVFRHAMRSDTGCVRSNNEDAARLIARADGSLVAILADGMGGHAAGEVASGITIETIGRAAEAMRTPADLDRAIADANHGIRDAMTLEPARAGMGTTCVVLVLQDGFALCAHVGDSRCYVARQDTLYRLTEDHSQVRLLVRDGIIADREARHHPDKNVILRALGPATRVPVTLLDPPFAVQAGDRFLLSSDGLHDLADDEEILPVLAAGAPADAADNLIALARNRGAPDNVTVCVVDALRASEAPPTRLPDTRSIAVRP